MTAISEKLRSVDHVFVVGHKNLDMDALGSAVGMQLFSSNVMDESMLFMMLSKCLLIFIEL